MASATRRLTNPHTQRTYTVAKASDLSLGSSGWVAMCDTHGTFVDARTRAKARERAESPTWCHACTDTAPEPVQNMTSPTTGASYIVGRAQDVGIDSVDGWVALCVTHKAKSYASASTVEEAMAATESPGWCPGCARMLRVQLRETLMLPKPGRPPLEGGRLNVAIRKPQTGKSRPSSSFSLTYEHLAKIDRYKDRFTGGNASNGLRELIDRGYAAAFPLEDEDSAA